MIYSRKNTRDGLRYWFIRYSLPDGRRKREKAGMTKRDAVELLTRRRAELIAGTWVDPDAVPTDEGPTFREFAERFLAEHPGRRRSDHYQDTLPRIVDTFGDRLVSEITRADLDRFRVQLETTTIARLGRPLSATSVVKILRTTGRVFKMAVRWSVIEVSPATDLEKPSLPAPKTRYLSSEEFARLEAHAPTWLMPMLRMAVATGMRLKEVTGLRWAEIDRKAGVLHVPQNSKTGTRVIPLSVTVKAVFDDQVRHVRSEYVFVDSTGRSHTSESRRNRISAATSAAMKTAGIDGASFHTLRHTAAAWMVQAGVPLYEVQVILGHSTPVMTQRYAHLQPGHLKGGMDALDRALEGPISDPNSIRAVGNNSGTSRKS